MSLWWHKCPTCNEFKYERDLVAHDGGAEFATCTRCRFSWSAAYVRDLDTRARVGIVGEDGSRYAGGSLGCGGTPDHQAHVDALVGQMTSAPVGRAAMGRALERGEGRKDDDAKERWDLLPFATLVEVVRVLTIGAKKYAPDNWKKVPGARRRYLAAAFRHLAARACGELRDPETKLPHTAHAIACLLFLTEFDAGAVPEVPETGDRGAP